MKLKRKLKILVTAGPTREPIDPVRFISNYSTGFLGYAIAQEARRRGHRVILISGPTSLDKPQGVARVCVETARQMQQQLRQRFSWCDCLIMAAAVGDFRARQVARKKIKRGAGKNKSRTLELKENPDILQGLALRKGRKVLAGLALETENLQQNAQGKLRSKNLDLIVATSMKPKSYPFGAVRLDVLIMDRNQRTKIVKQATKPQLARIFLDSIENIVLSYIFN